MRQPGLAWRLLRRALEESRVVRIILLSQKGRVTQFVERIEPHLRLKGRKSKYQLPLIVCVSTVPPPNLALRDLFRKQVFFLDAESPRVLHRVLRKLAIARPRPRLFSRASTRHRFNSAWDLAVTHEHGVIQTRETDEMLEQLQIQRDSTIVLLSTRSASYYRALSRRPGNMRYGSAVSEDTQVRNPDIDTYLAAARYLRSEGIVVVRIGLHQAPLSPAWNEVAIDYSTHSRTPRRDLLLARRCEFLLNGASGAWCLTAMFNRPNINTNCYQPFAAAAVSSRDLFSHQLIRDTRTGHFLTFREMARVGSCATFHSRAIKAGVELVPHSDQLITDIVREMLSRLSGTFIESRDDVRRREQFEAIRMSAGKGLREQGSVSATYLQRFEELLR